MNINIIEAVKIVHNELHGGEYRFLSDFFRMVGSFVGECYAYEKQLDTGYSVVILIKYGMSEDVIEDFRNRYGTMLIELEAIDLFATSNNEKVQYINNCIDQIKFTKEKNSTNSFEGEADILKQIARIYVNHNVMGNLESYPYFALEGDLFSKISQNLLNVHRQISSISCGKNGKEYIVYAKNDIARHINTMCGRNDVELFFDTRELVKEIQKEIIDKGIFGNAYLLQGMITQLDNRFMSDASIYYQRAAETMPERGYTHYIYYRIGVMAEKAGNIRNAIENYLKAFQINNKAYRSLYKIAKLYAEMGEYAKGIEFYKKIITLLSNKYEHNYLQRKEYDYIYKSYQSISDIWMNALGDSREAINYLEELNKAFDKPSHSNMIYEQIYGENARRFLDITVRSLPKREIFYALAKAYMNIGNYEMADQNWENGQQYTG